MTICYRFVVLCCMLSFSLPVAAQTAVSQPRLGDVDSRLTQVDVESGQMSLMDLRVAGLKMFATPFNRLDGFGDGEFSALEPGQPARPTLANNGTFSRINGLDGQSCTECHAQVSSKTFPPTFGIGGFGGINDAPLFMATEVDVSDVAENGFAFTDGRLIVPPHLFGAGGVQLVGKEMTADLQALREYALSNPGQRVELRSKGVSFGSIEADVEGNVDTSLVEGVDEDLVVKPFGRKGEFPSMRAFDVDAMMFHFGMQPVEAVGQNVDEDGDGVTNEVLVGEMSALEVFVTTMEAPAMEPLTLARAQGLALFNTVGCAGCHRPVLNAQSSKLGYAFPEVADDPDANVFFEVDLVKDLPRFKRSLDGRSVMVPLFSDLKRHDMGPELAENFRGADLKRNAEFMTAKLWGVADTGPYLHDGRALTLEDAILLHGGEAQDVRDTFAALHDTDKLKILDFLNGLRTPKAPNAAVIEAAQAQ